jgi:hypothetical protein
MLDGDSPKSPFEVTTGPFLITLIAAIALEETRELVIWCSTTREEKPHPYSRMMASETPYGKFGITLTI